MFSCNKIKLIILMTFCDRSVIVCLELLSFSMWIATSRLHSGFLCYCKPKYGEFSEQVITLSAWFWNLETPRFRLPRHCSLKRIWLMSNHRRIQEAYAHWTIRSVSHTSSTISNEYFHGFNVSHRTAKNLAVRNKKLQKRLTVKISLDMVTERN